MSRYGVRALVDVTEPPLPGVNGTPSYREIASQAIWLTAQFAKALWVRRAQDLGIRHSGEYLRGIQEAIIQQTKGGDTPDGFDFTLEIRNNAPHAGIVEHGHAAFSMPRAIDWSGPNVKRGKKGPYLRIPFRHAAYQTAAQRERSGMTLGTLKTMMPEQIYERARLLQPVRGGTGPGRTSGQRLQHHMPGPGTIVGPGGAAVQAWRGEHIVQGLDRHGNRLTNPAWKSSKFHGMFRAGPKGHTRYMTIRTITPRSAGWNIPAQQGRRVAEQVARVLNGGAGHDRFRKFLVDEIRKRLGVKP